MTRTGKQSLVALAFLEPSTKNIDFYVLLVSLLQRARKFNFFESNPILYPAISLVE